MFGLKHHIEGLTQEGVKPFRARKRNGLRISLRFILALP